jgi:threonine/homoserine/homoserine lactone efflux protein
MDLLNFATTVIIISGSGAIAPGPLFFLTVTYGVKNGAKTGVLFSVAHSIVEFTLVLTLALGLLSITNETVVRFVVGIAGGVALIVFGTIQIRSSLNEADESDSRSRTKRGLFLIGLASTGLNPYFIVWWLTIGASLILISLEFAGLVGVMIMYACHVWVDYAWLMLVSGFAKRGAKILKQKWYRLLIAVFGVILIFFGLSFIMDALLF